MADFNPALYPIATANIGAQFQMFMAETDNADDIVDFTTATNILKFYAGSIGITPDVNQAPYDYFEVPTTIRFNTSTIINGDMGTLATVNSVAYFMAKMLNNYTTGDLTNGMINFVARESFKITATRTGTDVTSLKFDINTAPLTTFTVPVTTGMTITEALEAINTASPSTPEGQKYLTANIMVGDGAEVFNILPNTETVFEFSTRFGFIDTHALTVTEQAKYPKKITMATPKINYTKFWNVLLYNSANPDLSHQFIGINSKSLNLSFANNGLVEMTLNLLGKAAIKTNLTATAAPAFVDHYEKAYTQSTGNTFVHWDGSYAGSIKDMQIAFEFDRDIALNITGINIPYPNGKYNYGWSGSSILNETAYKMFYEQMLAGRRPCVILNSQQDIEDVSYRMWIIANTLKGKPSKVEVQSGALELPFPADAVGENSPNVDGSNMYVFLHDEIAGFVNNP